MYFLLISFIKAFIFGWIRYYLHLLLWEVVLGNDLILYWGISCGIFHISEGSTRFCFLQLVLIVRPLHQQELLCRLGLIFDLSSCFLNSYAKSPSSAATSSKSIISKSNGRLTLKSTSVSTERAGLRFISRIHVFKSVSIMKSKPYSSKQPCGCGGTSCATGRSVRITSALILH